MAQQKILTPIIMNFRTATKQHQFSQQPFVPISNFSLSNSLKNNSQRAFSANMNYSGVFKRSEIENYNPQMMFGRTENSFQKMQEEQQKPFQRNVFGSSEFNFKESPIQTNFSQSLAFEPMTQQPQAITRQEPTQPVCQQSQQKIQDQFMGILLPKLEQILTKFKEQLEEEKNECKYDKALNELQTIIDKSNKELESMNAKLGQIEEQIKQKKQGEEQNEKESVNENLLLQLKAQQASIDSHTSAADELKEEIKTLNWRWNHLQIQVDHQINENNIMNMDRATRIKEDCTKYFSKKK